MTTPERSIEEINQWAYDSILFNHNPIEADKPFGDMLNFVLEKLITTILQTERQKRDEVESNNLQAVMDTVVMLHEQEEINDAAFCKLRDLLHGIALTQPNNPN